MWGTLVSDGGGGVSVRKAQTEGGNGFAQRRHGPANPAGEAVS
jgi:hypothetical protein